MSACRSTRTAQKRRSIRASLTRHSTFQMLNRRDMMAADMLVAEEFSVADVSKLDVPAVVAREHTASRSEAIVRLDSDEQVSIGNVRQGIFVTEKSQYAGYIMYSEQVLLKRFLHAPPHTDSADHLIAVTFQDGQWLYDGAKGLTAFEPRDSDVLVAEVDLDQRLINDLAGRNTELQGIAAGYETGDIQFQISRSDSRRTTGEFLVKGSHFSRNMEAPQGERTEVGTIDFGIAARDDRQGVGFIMFSETSLFERFSNAPPHANNAEHLITVVFQDNTW